MQLVADIQIGGWFVKEQHLGILGQRHSDPHPLLLPAGQFGNRFIFMLVGMGDLHGPVDFFFILLRIRGQPHGVIGCSSVAHQLFYAQIHRRGVVLVDDRDFFCKVFEPHPDNIAAPQEDFPLVRAEIFRHQVEKSTLSAAVGANQSSDFSLVQLQVEMFQHLLLAVGKGKVFDSKHVIVHSFASTS